jgi:serine/threonine-protein kinase RsbW
VRAHFEFPCEIESARRAGQAVRQVLERAGCGTAEILECELAVVEGCNNAVEYVSPAARLRPILADVDCTAETIEIRITDHTPGFDWPPQIEPPPPEAERGRGIFVIQSVVDCAKYLRGPAGNVLVLTRRRRQFETR